MKNIIIAEFKHETNSFMPEITDEAIFQARNYLFGDEIAARFHGVKNEIAAFLDFFETEPSFKLIPVLAFNAQPGGPVAEDVFETAKKKLLEAVSREPQLDGILLALHGAMVTTQRQDGEGDLLEALRNAVGADVPIVASLDLHANMTQKMVQNATAFFVFDYYPHVDMYETGRRAAECMFHILNGRIVPVMKFCKLKLMLPYMPTELQPMAGFVKQEQDLRSQKKILNVNICHGFFAADINDQGMAVIAVTDGDDVLAQETADNLGGQIWDARKDLTRKFYTIDQAIDEVLGSDKGPFVFADVADNPGSGASCDGTIMLRRMLERNVKNAALAVMYDPETVKEAEKVGVGSVFRAKLGGKTCPEIAGEPLECDAYVKAITDGKYVNKDVMSKGVLTSLGKTAVLDINGILVLVSSVRTQPWDLEAYRSNGITPQSMKILMVKSAVHYRASFGTVAHKIMDVELPALAPQSPAMFNYKNAVRPLFPLDDI